MYLVENERTKLTAPWFNKLATALIAAGAFAPMAAIVIGISAFPISIARVVVLAVGCVAFGTAIHIAGRAILRRLRE
jgi:hypothetical protein